MKLVLSFLFIFIVMLHDKRMSFVIYSQYFTCIILTDQPCLSLCQNLGTVWSWSHLIAEDLNVFLLYGPDLGLSDV